MGFQFRNRINGGAATVRSLPSNAGRGSARGDMLAVAGDGVEAGSAAATDLLGAAIDADGAIVQAIVDGDAIYAVEDPHARRRGERLELAGARGVAAGVHAQLVVMANSAATEHTLVRIRPDRHQAVSGSAERRLAPVQLNAAIARAIVQVHHEYVGRGPTKARAFIRDDVVVVMLEQAMTTAERSLVGDGRNDAVLRARRELHDAMRPLLVAAIEGVTRCRVSAALSDSCLEPDMVVFVFVLDRPVRTAPDPADPSQTR